MRRAAEKRRIVLFVEGDAETMTLSSFFHKWIDPQLPAQTKVGFIVENFKGINKYLDQLETQLDLNLNRGRANFVVGIVDLYGLPSQIDLSKCLTRKDKVQSARQQILQHVPAKLRKRFRLHFAVHEFEAWLLAYPEKWPQSIRDQITKKAPEDVNFNEPPAKFVKRLLRGSYKKTVMGRNILRTADPQIAIDKCPYLKLLAEDLLQIAKALV